MIRPGQDKKEQHDEEIACTNWTDDYCMTYTFLMTNDKTACHSKLMFLRIPLHTKGVEIGYIYEWPY